MNILTAPFCHQVFYCNKRFLGAHEETAGDWLLGFCIIAFVVFPLLYFAAFLAASGLRNCFIRVESKCSSLRCFILQLRFKVLLYVPGASRRVLHCRNCTTLKFCYKKLSIYNVLVIFYNKISYKNPI